MRAFVLFACFVACAPPTPASIDTTADGYLERRESPSTIVDSRGV